MTGTPEYADVISRAGLTFTASAWVEAKLPAQIERKRDI